jgi:hypothetical protein
VLRAGTGRGRYCAVKGCHIGAGKARCHLAGFDALYRSALRLARGRPLRPTTRTRGRLVSGAPPAGQTIGEAPAGGRIGKGLSARHLWSADQPGRSLHLRPGAVLRRADRVISGVQRKAVSGWPSLVAAAPYSLSSRVWARSDAPLSRIEHARGQLYLEGGDPVGKGPHVVFDPLSVGTGEYSVDGDAKARTRGGVDDSVDRVALGRGTKRQDD